MDIVTDKSFKYNLEKLDSTSAEFKFIKGLYDADDTDDYIVQRNNFEIYKVIENNSIKASEAKRNNLMLFHGTNRKGAAGILKEGFKNSKRGWFGKGIYMTDCPGTACAYSYLNRISASSEKLIYFNFVNEVLESEKLQTFELDMFNGMKDIETPLKYPFVKQVDKYSLRATEENYINDHVGRKYINITLDEYDGGFDEYVAEENITIPRYLITFEMC